MNGPEIKHTLRKLDYPQCAQEALLKIGKIDFETLKQILICLFLLGQLICGRVPNIKYMDLALDLMAEFVFCEVDRRGNKKQVPLNVQLEMQLLEVLFDYFNTTQTESIKNAIFLSLFSGTAALSRSRILNKFVSIAVGICSAVVLTSAGIWMQQLGNTSSNSCKLAEALVKDYFILIPSVDRLKPMPSVAPQFIANFLTAVGEIYYTDTKKGQVMFPPQPLLEIVAYWVCCANNRITFINNCLIGFVDFRK